MLIELGPIFIGNAPGAPQMIPYLTALLAFLGLTATIGFAVLTFRHNTARILFDAMFKYVDLTGDETYVAVREIISRTPAAELQNVKDSMPVQMSETLREHAKAVVGSDERFVRKNLETFEISEPADLAKLRAGLFKVVNTIEAIATMYRSGFVPKKTFIEEFQNALRRDNRFVFHNFVEEGNSSLFPSIKFLNKAIEKELMTKGLKTSSQDPTLPKQDTPE